MEPKIIFEDDQIIVIDKPAGITVNKSDTTKGQVTIQDWAETKIKKQRSKIKDIEEETRSTRDAFDIRDAFYQRAGIVHRLDKETSGILLIAKNPASFENLQKQFKERNVKKIYTALVHGRVVPDEGEIRVPVGRLPWNRKQFGVIAGGRDAVTKFKVLSNYTLNANPYTLLELYPETGRTHQIRVHLKYAGYPIFSDFLYAGRKTSRNDRKILNRVFLHASKISFIHPASTAKPASQGERGEPTKGERVSFESPLPEELKSFLDKLKQ